MTVDYKLAIRILWTIPALVILATSGFGMDVIVLAGIFWLAGLIFLPLWAESILKEDKNAINEIEHIIRKHGFIKTSPKKILSFLTAESNTWYGTYRGRNFSMEFFYYSGRSLIGERFALRIITLNASGQGTWIATDNKDEMYKAGIGDVYKRLHGIGIYPVPLVWIPLGQLFGIHKDIIRFILPGSLISAKNIRESLDIVCDTLDLLNGKHSKHVHSVSI